MARCASQKEKKERGKNNSKKTPSVLAVSPTLSTLQLYRITIFTSIIGSAALSESGYISLQNYHVQTHKPGNLTFGIQLGGG